MMHGPKPIIFPNPHRRTNRVQISILKEWICWPKNKWRRRKEGIIPISEVVITWQSCCCNENDSIYHINI